ncbi:MAG: hypothetical protein IT371_23005 [Deltaproteobacteria bacterium]|nr:hypothetical protein [Deltaproteobacteria bacterium]
MEHGTFQPYGGRETDYRPERWEGFREDYGFTGKEEDVEVALTYFGYRYLSTALGRWASADPLTVHGRARAGSGLERLRLRERAGAAGGGSGGAHRGERRHHGTHRVRVRPRPRCGWESNRRLLPDQQRLRAAGARGGCERRGPSSLAPSEGDLQGPALRGGRGGRRCRGGRHRGVAIPAGGVADPPLRQPRRRHGGRRPRLGG